MKGIDAGWPNKPAADESMQGAAALLDPAHGNFTRHLTYIRLVGPPTADFMAGRLEQIARNHDFEVDF